MIIDRSPGSRPACAARRHVRFWPIADSPPPLLTFVVRSGKCIMRSRPLPLTMLLTRDQRVVGGGLPLAKKKGTGANLGPFPLRGAS